MKKVVGTWLDGAAALREGGLAEEGPSPPDSGRMVRVGCVARGEWMSGCPYGGVKGCLGDGGIDVWGTPQPRSWTVLRIDVQYSIYCRLL